MLYSVCYKSLCVLNRSIWGKNDEKDEVTKSYLRRNAFCTSSRLFLLGIILYLLDVYMIFIKMCSFPIKNFILDHYGIVIVILVLNLLAELKNRLKISIFLWRKKLCISLIFSNFVVSNYKVIYFTLCTTCMQIS